ncbi:reactive chlorine resistance membrane protein RclC [Rhodanobacter sp. MP7CTX1]|uniref:reactive chlorine resistance membrane protein RclC n=1 Tax=Rhodanobacter sp. MP7CTX1 TaxID=2723084 RepID=UPI0016197502|nr:reactive chlorine resistance membrane protein RclC [Rhodanobacter sp. MP7CTX1]MBB6186985.1 putative membrane protein YkgB [Rhodanobacter sp. MP7CTX1]
MNSKIEQGLGAFARTDHAGLVLMRLAIAIVFLWIGGLKFAPYEADSITPFVANSPVMSFFYEHPQDYKEHMTHEGALVPAQREWQTENHTYSFSRGLGTVELMIGLLVLSYPLSKRLGLLGAFLAFVTTLVTLSFLITTPEAWVPALGDAQHGFPYLSGGGRLVVKDTMMLAGAWIIGIDAAKGILSDMHTKLAGVR